MEGNGKDTSNDELFSSAVEMDVFEDSVQEIDNNISPKGEAFKLLAKCLEWITYL